MRGVYLFATEPCQLGGICQWWHPQLRREFKRRLKHVLVTESGVEPGPHDIDDLTECVGIAGVNGRTITQTPFVVDLERRRLGVPGTVWRGDDG